ncbi:MAG TPA: type IX secretion system membrane protein PorP/SprF [Cyclobacteriaceae bacterium]|nr:type IX secretion system membrane protein PorP/SprF [Cyclobacteriaceae bacterium]HRJ83523.1 type IX secretion system membrane protein PorP/SprF [Cyclobacteriaceae bacterium]
MRRIYSIAIVFISAVAGVHGQFVPYSNQMFQFASSYNPAFSGVDPFGDLRLGYRAQWTGFGSEGPKFVNMAFNTRLKQPLDLTHNALRTSQSDLLKPENLPKGKRIIHGFGVNVFNEKISIIDRIGGGINYSFHYPVTKKVYLASGIAAVLDNTRVRVNELYLGINPDPDSYYDNLVTNGVNQTDLNVRAGVLLYSSRFYVGFSYFDLLHKQINASDVNFAEPFYKGSAQLGFSFPLSINLDVRPSVFALWQMNNDFIIDYNLKLYIQNKLWLGLTYRGTESMVTMAGFNFNHVLGVSYSFERSTNGLKQFGDGSHELILGLRLNNFKRMQSQVW